MVARSFINAFRVRVAHDSIKPGVQRAKRANPRAAKRVSACGVGGVSTAELSSQTMEARRVPGLYFIGEVVDVTGQLGGYNFQWAWASAFAADQVV